MPGPFLNKVFLIGRLTRDPELRYTPSGKAVATFGFAVNREYISKGEKKEETCYLNMVVWGRQAEICAEYLKKGNLIFVEGRLQYRTWETEDSEKKSVIEIRVERFQFLEKPSPIEIIEEKEEMENGEETEGL
ncbi:MAG: single-stranded DNA-binding protein [Candidatus Omnitrophica bacterium]|nr:single-stranded DNA-binding protein [Candidatus Omnitrophota bacterium]MCM8806540.1 single-stranded DNA-binding protein [Candidatus Omnitrophota bacterium]